MEIELEIVVIDVNCVLGRSGSTVGDCGGLWVPLVASTGFKSIQTDTMVSGSGFGSPDRF